MKRHPSSTILPALRPLTLVLRASSFALLTTLPFGAVHAQSQVESAHDYAIPAGTLATVLARVVEVSGVLLAGSPALTQNKLSEGLGGRYGADEALSRILAPHGLQAVRAADGSYRLQPLPPSASEAPVLAPVRISADAAIRDGAVDQGYRTERVSEVGPWQGRSLQDTPYSMTVISKELIENLQATTPDQLLRVNPTTQLSRSQHENDQPAFTMRGFRVQNAYSDGLLGDQYGHGTTTEDAERIEILTGLSGFLYGPGNIGGMVNYVSKRPTEERLTRLAVGSNGGSSYYAHGDFGGPIDADGRFGYRINALAQDGDTATDNLEIKKTFLSGAFDWNITDRLLLQVNAVRREYEPTGQANWVFAPGVSRPSASSLDPGKSWGQPWGNSAYDNTKYGARLRWEATDALTLRAAWLDNKSNRATVFARNLIQPDGTYDQTVFNYYAPGSNRTSSEQNDQSGHVFVDMAFGTGPLNHKVTAGFQHRRQRQYRFTNNAAGEVFQDLSLAGPVYVPRPDIEAVDRGEFVKVSASETRNIMIGDDIALGDRWSALLGIAHSTIEIGEITGPIFPGKGYRESAVTPNVSLIYKPVPAVTLYGSYIEALEQGGTAAEQFGGSPVVNAGTVMEPLISEQIELGAKASVGGLLLTTALFQIDKGLQYYDITVPTAPVYVQDGRQQHRGIEATVLGKATQQLTLIGGITWLDAEVKEQKQSPAVEGKRPALVAETLAKLRAEYQLKSLSALTLIAGVNYTADQYVDVNNTDRLPSYTLFDVGARYEMQLAGYPLTLRLEANNLSDKAYWANGSVVGDPRAIAFSASMEF